MADEAKAATNVNIIATEKYVDDKLVNFDTDYMQAKYVTKDQFFKNSTNCLTLNGKKYAVKNGTIAVDEVDALKVNNRYVWIGTEAEFELIEDKDISTTIYLITDAEGHIRSCTDDTKADWVTNHDVGALSAGTNISGLNALEIIRLATVAYVYPKCNVTFSQSNEILELGASFDLLVSVNNVVKGTNDVVRIDLYKDNTWVESWAYTDEKTSFSFLTLTDITSDTSIEIRIYDTEEKYTAYSKDYKFVAPYYVGALDDIPTVDTLVTLTKLVEAKSNKSKKLNINNQYVVFAYNSAYGELTSILDESGFENLYDFNKIFLTVNSISYIVYCTMSKKKLDNFNYIFKY